MRALHLEIAEDCSAIAFLNAFKRFVATRGRPQRVVTDNGSNFVRSARALGALWENMKNGEVQEYMSSVGTS